MPLGTQRKLDDALAAFAQEARTGVCQTRHYRCPYYEWGQGPPLVFIPGLARFVVLGLFMLALAFGAVYSGIRWLTYERYVSASAA